MNDIERFCEFITAHPDDKVAALAAVDFLQDREDQPRRVALRNVAKWRKDARDAQQMADAAAIMSAGSPLREPVEHLIREAGSEEWRVISTILIVPGSRHPKPVRRSRSKGPVSWFDYFMLIGARRVLMLAECVRESRECLEVDEWEPAGNGTND